MKTILLILLLSINSVAQNIIKDINPGGGGSIPTNLTVIGTVAYFSANNGTLGPELWRTDGTTSGTVLIKDINPGKPGSTPGHFTACGNKVFFSATTVTSGEELYVIEGTAVRLVKDIWPGINSSGIKEITAVGNYVYFVANNGTIGSELWKSDGITTSLVRDFRIGKDDGKIGVMAQYNGKLYLSRNLDWDAGQLWKLDPLTGKITMLFSHPYHNINNIAVAFGKLYYGEGGYSDYTDINGLNLDEKGGTFFMSDPGYSLSWMKNIQGRLVIAGADEYNPWSVQIAESPVKQIGWGEGVQAVAFNGKEQYFSVYDYQQETGVEDGYRIVKGSYNATQTQIAVYKGRITEMVGFYGKVIYAAYTSQNGNELRIVNQSNLRMAEPMTSTGIPYPNPASSFIKYKPKETGIVSTQIRDIKGNILYQNEKEGVKEEEMQFDFDIKGGLYVVSIAEGVKVRNYHLYIRK